MTQLKEAISLLKKWRAKACPGSDQERELGTLIEQTDNFLEAYRVSLDG